MSPDELAARLEQAEAELARMRVELGHARLAASSVRTDLVRSRERVAALKAEARLGGELFRVEWSRPGWVRPHVRVRRTPEGARKLVARIVKFPVDYVQIEKATVNAWGPTTCASDLIAQAEGRSR